MMTPIIIPMPMCSGSIGNPTDLQILWVILGVLYVSQIVIVWCQMFLDYFPNKKSILFWHIPFIPFIYLMIKKFMSIGKVKEIGGGSSEYTWKDK